MINKFYRLFIFLTLLTVGLSSCSEEDANYYGSISLQKTALFVENWGDSQATTFSLDNVASMEINQNYSDDWTGETVAESWKIELEFYKGLIKVTAPTQSGKTLAGKPNNIVEVSLKGETHDGYSIYKTIKLGVVPFVYIDTVEDKQSNSMIVTEPGKFYIFSPTFKGEDKSQTLSGVDDCRLLWKSYSCSMNYIQMLSPTEVGFYVDYDENDVDEDDIEDDLVQGNGVIAALNSSGEVLWSWHIWAVDEDPTDASRTVSFNNRVWMDCNLGAFQNDISTVDNILESYGLYYQWGRKDPFIQPYTYNAAGGYDALMEVGSISYKESSSEIGNVEYAIEHPLTYIYAEEGGDSSYDWLYRSHNKELWNDDAKSIYDPSPKGWRVPKSNDFEGVTLESFPSAAVDADAAYGAYITDGTTSELFIGGGRRVYVTGRISNINTDYYSLAPWSAFYWTSGADDNSNKAVCFRFDNGSDDKDAVTDSNGTYYFQTRHENHRANGIQIRCVKM